MADIKDRIIEGAAHCFVRYGYSKTTLDDIGKSVGLKKNSLYHYFKNKEDIFFAVLKRELRHTGIERQQLVHAATGIKDQIAAYMQWRLQSCTQPTILHAILTETWDSQHPLFYRVFGLLREDETNFLESLFLTAYRNHEIIEYDYKMLAESLLVIFTAVKQQEFNYPSLDPEDQPAMKHDKHVLFIVETMLKGLKAQ